MFGLDTNEPAPCLVMIHLSVRRVCSASRTTTRLTQMEAADNLEQFTQADYGFHYAIVRASHNRIFCRTMDACREPMFQE